MPTKYLMIAVLIIYHIDVEHNVSSFNGILLYYFFVLKMKKRIIYIQ
jgi:hypothetical protein